MRSYIEYKRWIFTADKIESGNIYLPVSLIFSSLEAGTLNVSVRCPDPDILDFERNDILRYHARQGCPLVFYVQKIRRLGQGIYSISATSVLALLAEGKHLGGIYTGQTADEVLPELMGNIPYIIKRNLGRAAIYGWLPVASPRDNLAQILFAIGGAVTSDRDGVVHITGLWDGVSGSVIADDIYGESSASSDNKVTQVIVTEHQYSPGTEETVLFEGTAKEDDPIKFREPMHSLTADGFTILESGPNYARLSAGPGTLRGKAYIHSTRQIAQDVYSSRIPNIKQEENSTLVSLVNSAAVVRRMAAYYRCRETVSVPVVYRGELPGDILSIWHPFDKQYVSACLMSADINLSNTLRAEEKSLVGFAPPQTEDVEIYDDQALITASMEYEIQEGVTHITCVLISGGDGGGAGYDGESGEDGTSASVTSGQTGTKLGTAGAGGDGGEPGIPGQGGKFIRIDLDVEPGDKLIIEVGTGGTPGTENGEPGQSGTATRLRYKGAVYSSEDGARSELGFTDVMTGTVYAAPGAHGEKGGSGGKGGIGGGSTEPAHAGEDVDTASGGVPGSNFVKRSSAQKLGTIPSVTQKWTQYPDRNCGTNWYRGTSGYAVDQQYGTISQSGASKTVGYTTTTDTPSGGYRNYETGTIYTTPSNPTPTYDNHTVVSIITEYTVTWAGAGTTGWLKERLLQVTRSYPQYRVDLVAGTYSSGGGGAAFGQNGSDSTVESDRTRGGDGANALPPTDPTVPGAGGDAGHGGGGSGGGGAGESTATGTPGDMSYSYTGYGGTAGTPGKASRGAPGAPGAALLYFGVARKIQSGAVMDRTGRYFLDRTGRLMIV